MKWEIIKNAYKNRRFPVNRLIIGEKMDVNLSEIKIFKPQRSFTGEIGFMDYQVIVRHVPKKDAPKNPIKDEFYTKMKSFTILLIGIEPKYQGKRFFKKFINFAEEFAKASGCECIVYDSIHNEKVIGWAMKYDFKLFLNDAVKYL